MSIGGSMQPIGVTAAFNHIIGPPKKDGVEKPFYDYEKLLYNALLGSHDIGS